MVDKDNISHHKIPSLFQKNLIFKSFITQEITKKIDLVAHLVENSHKDIVLLGPEGVGKSTLISILLKQKKDYWFNFILPATINLTYEIIVDKINHYKNKALFDKRVKHHVLIIDDANNLPAGIINSILNHAQDFLNFKVILLFTNEEYELKTVSDALLKDCYLIEISPLTKNQCADFIQFLDPHTPSAFLEYEDNKIEEIYAETQGLPGKIVQLLPRTLHLQETNRTLFFLMTAVITLVILALTIQWDTDPNIKNELTNLRSIIDKMLQYID